MHRKSGEKANIFPIVLAQICRHQIIPLPQQLDLDDNHSSEEELEDIIGTKKVITATDRDRGDKHCSDDLIMVMNVVSIGTKRRSKYVILFFCC